MAKNKYWTIKDSIKDFFRASIDRTLDDFDFEKAFKYSGDVIYRKLTEHGLTTLEEFIEDEEDIIGIHPVDLSQYAIYSDWIVISEEDIHEAILTYVYERMRSYYGNMYVFKELEHLYDQIQHAHILSTGEKAILFDAIIHAQHASDSIFEDVDIEALKEEIDKEYS